MATRHSLLSWAYLAIMHLVIFGTSGMKSEQTCMASDAQAWRTSGLPWAAAAVRPINNKPAGSTGQETRRVIRMWFASPVLVPCGLSGRRRLEHDRGKWKPHFRKNFVFHR